MLNIRCQVYKLYGVTLWIGDRIPLPITANALMPVAACIASYFCSIICYYGIASLLPEISVLKKNMQTTSKSSLVVS